MSEPAKRLDEIHWEAIWAFSHDVPLADNPYEPNTPQWWYWRLTWLAFQEEEEFEQSLPQQVEREIEEQPFWEKREREGINTLVARIHRRVDGLAQWFGYRMVPECMIDGDRQLVRESVNELLGRKP